MTTSGTPTVAEQIQLSGLITMEATGLQSAQAGLPMIADPELRQQIEAGIQTGKTHLTALMGFSKEHHFA